MMQYLRARTVSWSCAVLFMFGCMQVRAQEPTDESAAEPPRTVPQVPPDLAPEARQLPLGERLLLRQQWINYREYERKSVGVVGPSFMLVLGAGAAATSAWLFTGNRNERIGATGVALFVAAPLLGVSIALLVERVSKRRAIEREIWTAPPVTGNPFLWKF